MWVSTSVAGCGAATVPPRPMKAMTEKTLKGSIGRRGRYARATIFLAEKLVRRQVGRTESRMNPLRRGFVEVDIRIDDVWVIGLEPRNISRTNLSLFPRHQQRESSSPMRIRCRENGLQHGLPVLMLLDQIGNPKGPRTYICFHAKESFLRARPRSNLFRWKARENRRARFPEGWPSTRPRAENSLKEGKLSLR